MERIKDSSQERVEKVYKNHFVVFDENHFLVEQMFAQVSERASVRLSHVKDDNFIGVKHFKLVLAYWVHHTH